MEECFVFLTLENGVSCGCIMLKDIPSIPDVFRGFLVIGCSVLSDAFSVSVEMVVRFLSFILLLCVTFIDLYMWIILASLEKMPQVRGVCVSGVLVCDFLFL